MPAIRSRAPAWIRTAPLPLAAILLGGSFAFAESPAQRSPAYEAAQRLGRGVNLGNTLEAPSEGAWGMTLEAEYFRRIAEAGFDSVRIPVRWSAHAADEPPYRIDPDFMKRVEWAVEQAMEHDLAAVLNVHHYDALYEAPDQHRERFLALWRQIGERFRDHPGTLYFELLNEPHDEFDAGMWNDLAADALEVVRESNPERFVIVGPVQWNQIEKLPDLELPEEDRRLIVTFHFYHPFQFTHQGAGWVEGSDAWLGTEWPSEEHPREDLTKRFRRAAEWSERRDRPLYLGEFGAYRRADRESRVRWTRFIRAEAERRGISWAYWEFGAGFGVYDRERDRWRRDLLEALIPPEE
jgi:endoglucanase